MDKTNETEIVQKRSFKHNDDESKTKERIKMLYKTHQTHQKFSIPLRKKRINKYDAVEEARYDDKNHK